MCTHTVAWPCSACGRAVSPAYYPVFAIATMYRYTHVTADKLPYGNHQLLLGGQQRGLILMPKPTIYSYTIKDSSGVKSTFDLSVAYDAATETAGALIGNFAALGGLLDAVIDGQIIDGRIIVDVAPDPSWKAAPVADSIVERTALLTFRQANTTYVASVDIPAISLSVLDAQEAPIINAGALQTFISNLTNQSTGIGGSATVFANSKYSNALLALVKAVTTFRKHRRSLDAKTTKIP